MLFMFVLDLEQWCIKKVAVCKRNQVICEIMEFVIGVLVVQDYVV